MRLVALVMTSVLGACAPARPSAAAFEVCEARPLGAPCGFVGPRGPVRGHCFVPPGAQEPACAPVRPPPAAIEACVGREPGEPCRFTGPRGPADGTCEAPPERPVACRPDHQNPLD